MTEVANSEFRTKAQVKEEGQLEQLKAMIESSSSSFGNPVQTPEYGELILIEEVNAFHSSCTYLKISRFGVKENAWECILDNIYQYEGRWIVILTGRENGKRTILELNERRYLTPLKDEEFQKVARFVITQTQNEKWSFSYQYAGWQTDARIKKALDIDRNADWNIPAWMRYEDFLQIHANLKNPIASMLNKAGLLNPFFPPDWLRGKRKEF